MNRALWPLMAAVTLLFCACAATSAPPLSSADPASPLAPASPASATRDDLRLDGPSQKTAELIDASEKESAPAKPAGPR